MASVGLNQRGLSSLFPRSPEKVGQNWIPVTTGTRVCNIVRTLLSFSVLAYFYTQRYQFLRIASSSGGKHDLIFHCFSTRGRLPLFFVILFEKSWEGSYWPDLDHMLKLGPISFCKGRWFTVMDNLHQKHMLELVEGYSSKEGRLFFSRNGEM